MQHDSEGKQCQDLSDYLSPFTPEGREVNPIIAKVDNPTLEFICFYKNWTDLAKFNKLQSFLKMEVEEGYRTAKMFKIYQTQFFDQILETYILSAPAVGFM